jgi:hypothetical protein
MGGLSGHMKHPWEDVTLTPADLKKMVRNGLYTEKIDGFGVQFRFNETTKKFHLIRNKAHIDRGGLDGTAIMSEYAGRDAGIAFWMAYNLINQPYLLLTVQELLQKTGGRELRVIGDIVYKDITNIIKYDAPFFAVHAITFDDTPLKVESFPWPKEFVVGHQVRVCGVDMNVVEGMIDRISPTKLDYNKTFEEIYREEFDRHWDSNILLYDELPIVKELMFRRMIGDKNASLKEIKDLSKSPEVIGALDKKLGSLFIECTTPVREIVTRIGSYLKEHAHSTLGKGYGMMDKMTSIPNYSVPTLDNIFEGLVFEYEGKTFKWTGSFGMYNKLYWDKIKNGTAY